MKYVLLVLTLLGMGIFALGHEVVPRYVFYPSTTLIATPTQRGLEYENLRLQTPDGETLAAWYIPAGPEAEGPGKGLTLLFFHGNAGNMSHRLESVAFFHSLGLSVCIIDYRGFGQSTGKPSVKGTIQDARTAWQWLTTHKNIPADQIIVSGHSLGGGVAAALAAQVVPKALILESTFTSLHGVGKTFLPWLPKFLFFQDYDSIRNIQTLNIPLLVVHSPTDEVVAFAMGRTLFESYPGPKWFVEIHGSHDWGWRSDGVVYEQGIRSFLEKLSSGTD